MQGDNLARNVFVLSLIITFIIAFIGRQISRKRAEDDLAGRSLNRWFVGLSAGATANSGFVVAGAVGLGYTTGMHWVMLPISWFLGDLVFWQWFPERINAFGHRSGAITISGMLGYGLRGRWAKALSLTTAVVIVAGLAGYTAAQWLAGQKFLTGAFGLSSGSALAAFALLIIAYSSIGGFRGSVYADTFQAVIAIASTIFVFGAVTWFAMENMHAFETNILKAGPGFLNPFPNTTLVGVLGFVGGWASAALGFGLGQPQVTSRYLSSRSPTETRAARWIYLSYVQFTWILMTVFGMLLRGLMPGLHDPESGLSVFAQGYLFPIATGIVIANIFGFIASTANSLLVAIAQSVKHDIVGAALPSNISKRVPLGVIILLMGMASMALSTVKGGTVVSLALTSVSMIGAGLAVPVMIKVMNWRHTGASLTVATVIGIASAIAWVELGYSRSLNEAAIGMISSALANFAVLAFSSTREAFEAEEEVT